MRPTSSGTIDDPPVMRGLIIDHADRGRAQKRGGQFEITSFDIDIADLPADGQASSAIGDALDELAATSAQLAEVVNLKFFCGLSFGEIAALRGVSERTVQRQWDKARVYLAAGEQNPSCQPDRPQHSDAARATQPQ